MSNFIRQFISPTYQKGNEHFAKLSLRERVLATAVIAGLALFLIDQLLILRVTTERVGTERGIELTRTAIDTSNAAIAQFDLNKMSKEDREIASEIAQLRLQIQEIEQQMQATVESLVPPNAIVSVLEELLEPSDNLRLVRLKSHAPQPITSASADTTSDGEDALPAASDYAGAEPIILYRHRLTLEIEGGYAETTEYLKRIEASPWHLLWESFEYIVEDHPKAHVRIDLHTISDQEEWIGV